MPKPGFSQAFLWGWTGWLLLAAGSLQGQSFTDQSAYFTVLPPGFSEAYLSWGDYDNDGDLDLLVMGQTGTSTYTTKIYRNDGTGFVDSGTLDDNLPQLRRGIAVWGDYNEDGRLDILIAGENGSGQAISEIYRRNPGPAAPFIKDLTASSALSGSQVRNACADWGDYDNDGDLDLLITGNTGSSVIAKIYRNNGGSTFSEDVVASANLIGVENGTVRWADMDNDGFLDIMMIGNNSSGQPATRLYRNSGNGTFTNVVTLLPNLKNGSIDIGDYDGDGDLDLLLTGEDLGGSNFSSKVFRNDGGNVFTDINAPLTNVTQGHAAWGDYNDDGKMDIVLCGKSGPAATNRTTQVYLFNVGSNNFVLDAASSAALTDVDQNAYVAWGDYNGDKKLDLMIAGTGASGRVLKLFRNTNAAPNTVPAAPPTLSLNATQVGEDMVLSWNKPAGGTGYTFNLYVVNVATLDTLKAPMARILTGYRRIVGPGNVQHKTTWRMEGLTAGTYAWGVQSVDADFEGSVFATGVPFLYVPPAPGSLVFVDVTALEFAAPLPTGLTFSDISFADHDGDGDLDFIISGQSGLTRSTKVYRHFKNGVTYTENTAAGGSITDDISKGFSAWGDFDNDGDLDLLLSGQTAGNGRVTSIYRNDGNNTFSKLSAAAAPLLAMSGSSGAWGDYDNDGDLDILIAGNAAAGVVTKIYRNNGNGTFTEDVAASAGLTGVEFGAVAWGDYNNDGYLDFVVTGNTPGGAIGRIYRNKQDGTFEDSGIGIANVKNSAVAWGDYDNDGDLDLVIVGESTAPVAALYRNMGNGTFQTVSTILPGVTNGSVEFGDYNNDGFLDLLIVGQNTLLSTDRIVKIFQNNQSGGFVEDVVASGNLTAMNEGVGATWGDYDRDGKLDILMTGRSFGNAAVGTDVFKLYRNVEPTLNTVPQPPQNLQSALAGFSVNLTWDPPAGHPAATVNGLNYNLYVKTPSATVGDVVSPNSRLTDGYHKVVHLGNANLNKSFRLTGLTPGNYCWSVQAIDQDFEGSLFATEQCFIYDAPVFIDSTAAVFPLGVPAGLYDSDVVWGDFDSDGDLDILASGRTTALGFSTVIYDNVNGDFVLDPASTALVNVREGSVTFVDYDNDQDLDILVSGLSASGRITQLYEHLGNNTTNYFAAPGITFPALSKSAAAWGDYNNDGFADLLLTGENNSGNPQTLLYRNNGGASFSLVTTSITNVKNAGLAWADYDRDGDQDLLISGETTGAGAFSGIYRNDGNGVFTLITSGLPALKSSAVAWGDYDNSGYPDVLIAGQTAGGAAVSKVFKNNGNGTFSDILAPLSGVFSGSVHWGDYSNDGFADILLTGKSGPGAEDRVSKLYKYQPLTQNFVEDVVGQAPITAIDAGNAMFGDYNNDNRLDILLAGRSATTPAAGVFRILHNNDATPGVGPPPPPVSPTATLSGFDMLLSWNPPAGYPAARVNGLSYNVYIGATSTNPNQMAPLSMLATGRRKVVQMGNAGQMQTNFPVKGLVGGTYTWGVQAVDADYQGSPFISGGTFTYTPPTFIDVTTQLLSTLPPGLSEAHLEWGDYDNDGDLDLLVCGEVNASTNKTAIYRNNGGTFTEISAGLLGVAKGSASWGDYDNDGWLDILLSGELSGQPLTKVYRNINGTSFSDINAPITPVKDGAAIWGDVNNDGYLDVLVTGQGTVATGPVGEIFTYSPANGFTNSGIVLPKLIFSAAAWGDYNKDSYPDLIIAGQNPTTGVPITQLYRNDANGGLINTNLSFPGLRYPSLDWGDYDNDGHLDLLMTGEVTSPAVGELSRIYRNTGNGSAFTAVAAAAAPLTHVKQGEARWADFDNDGDLDIILTGQSGQTRVTEAYRNGGAGAFVNAPIVALPLADLDGGSSLAFGDFNNDGKLDLALAGRSATTPLSRTLRIYQNVDTLSNQVPGVPTGLQSVISADTVILSWNPPANAAGYSYNLYVGTTPAAPGNINRLSPMSNLSNGYRRVVRIGRAHNSTSFHLRDLPAGTYYWSVQAIGQDFEGSPFAAQQSFSYVPPMLVNSTPLVITPAPDGLNNGKLSWVDADRDGDLDLVATGEKGANDYVTRIYRNNNGVLSLVYDTVGVRWPAMAWADYNRDGYADLLLSGQNNAGNRVTLLLRNSGGSGLAPVAHPFPAVYAGAAAWGDYDNDGDPDLLISGNTGTNTYTTQIFRNEGGSFVLDEYASAQLPQVQFGAVAWGDYDADGWLDILIAGETTTGLVTKVFRNKRNRSFQDIAAPLPGVKEGSVEWGDFNNDGYLDILLTGESSATGFSPVSNIYRYNPGSSNFILFASGALNPVKRGSASWGDYNDDGWLDILLTGQNGPTSANRTTRLYRNQAGTGFVEESGSSLGLQNADLGSHAAWGDYNGDGKLDIALLGRTSDAPVTQRTLSVYRNVDPQPNLAIAAPINLSSVAAADSVTFQWQPPAGYAAALVNGLSYNLYLSSAPAPAIPDRVSPLARPSGYRSVVRLGPIEGTSWTIRNLPTGTWYWSVQAIDAAFDGSPFAAERTINYQAPIFIDETNFVTRSGNSAGFDQSALAWGDYDGDGDIDLLITGQTAGNAFRTALWKNVGGELQENAAATAALTDIRQGSVAWGDINRDDQLDIALSGESASGPITRIFRQQNGVFADINAGLAGLRNSSLAWADYDRDGDLDLLVTGETNVGIPQTFLYNNTGNGGNFANSGIVLEAVREGSVAWSDLDKDGWPDVLITGRDAGGLPVARLYRNNGNGTFGLLPAPFPGVMQSSVAWGDYNNDGWPDVLIAGQSASGPVTQLFRNNGNATFVNSGFNFAGIHKGSVAWGDYNDDGYADILLTGQNGANPSDRISRIYKNNGGTGFSVDPIASAPLVAANTLSTAAWGDYTGDGKLDIALAGRVGDAPLLRGLGFYKNNQPPPNPLLPAPDSLSNDASGADVLLSWAPPAGYNPALVKGLTYNICVGTVPGARDVVNPHADASGYRKIVAAGNVSLATSVRVTGLADGVYYWTVQAIGPDYEGSPFAAESSFRFNQKAFKDVTPEVFPFGLPAAVSEAALAFGDFDNNGYLDVVVAGALDNTNNSTTIYSNSTGLFQENPVAAANLAKLRKSAVDVGDYDNDGFVDIVLTGLNPAGNPVTHIYHNNGDNTFSLDATASAGLTAVSEGSVAWGDYNNDGNPDILLTGQSATGPFSMLYRNRGNGTFVAVPEAFAAGALKAVSRSSVAWGDYDRDGDLDFILTGRAASGPFTGVYRNNGNGTFTEMTTSMLNVMDGSVAWGDFDNDGDLDVIVSGENSSSLFVPVTRLYLYNATTGTFGDPPFSSSLLPVKNGSVSWGDYNKDGYSDVLISGRYGESDTAVATRIYRNEGGTGFSEDLNTSTVLANIELGQSLFGDFDNDNGLDIILTGRTRSNPPQRAFGAYLNIDSTLNITPPPPRNLMSEVVGNAVNLSWEAPTALPANRIPSLTYNLYVGTDAGEIDQLAPMSRLSDGYRRVVKMGGSNQSTQWTITGLRPGTYFWSVQTVDQDFEGSPFAPEEFFLFINPSPVIIDSSFARVYVDTTTNAVSSIEVLDTSVVDRVMLHYKGIAAADWSSIRLPGPGPVYHFNIGPAQLDEIGVEYYFQVVGKFGFSAVTDTTYTYIRYTGDGLQVPALTFGPKVTDYNILAIPLDLDDKSIANTIEDDLGPYDIFKWRFFHYQGGANQEYKSGVSQIEAGKGYWLIAKDRDTVMTGAGETVKVHGRKPFAISLRQGWNQIGNPYNFKISWNEVLDSNSVAVQGAFIEPFRNFRNGWDTIGTPIINAFRGGFVFAERAVELTIPVRKNLSIQRFAHIGGGITLENPIDDAEWEVNIRLESGGLVNPFGALGMRPDADSSRDKYDRISLPRLHQYLDMHFAHPEFFAPRFMKDVQASAKQAVWEFIVESNLGEEAIRISWANDFFGQGQRQLILFDVEHQRRIDMGERNSYTSVSTQASRLFRVYYGAPEWIDAHLQPDHVHLAQAYPNPFDEKTNIAFTLPPTIGVYDIVLEVLDPGGRRVRTLAEGRLEGGFYEWAWDGRNEAGQPVASGIYVYQLRVVQGGQQKLFSRKLIKH